MKIVSVILSAFAATSVYASEMDVCGTVIKVGDVNESQKVFFLKSETGETLKIFVASLRVAISTETARADLALAHGLRYCARVHAYDAKSVGLVRSSVEKK